MAGCRNSALSSNVILGVQREKLSSCGDERIDLHQRRVRLHKRFVQALQKGDSRIDLRGLQSQRKRQLRACNAPKPTAGSMSP